MRRVVVLLGALAFLPGCGPTISSYLILSAETELAAAKAAEAEKFSVYEFTAANEYLHKAREEQGYADFGPSIDFAYKAQELAKKATARADEEKRKLTEGPVDAQWEAPAEASKQGEQPKVIIKKSEQKTDDKMKVVPIPAPGPK